MDQVTEIPVQLLPTINHDLLVPMLGGETSHVYRYQEGNRDWIIKEGPAESVESDTFFYTTASALPNVYVPKVHEVMYGTDKAAYAADYISGFNDINRYEHRHFVSLAEGLKTLHGISFPGFGRLLGISDGIPIFEAKTNHEWLNQEMERLSEAIKLFRPEEMEILETIARQYSKYIPDTTVASLTHGDIGFGNIIITANDEPYLIDPGRIRAMTPLWEIAYFEYRYLNHPKESGMIRELRNAYLEGGATNDEEQEMAIYRVLHAIENQRTYWLKGYDNPRMEERLNRNVVLANKWIPDLHLLSLK